MTKKRLSELKVLLQGVLDELKNDDDRYLVYRVSGLSRAIADFEFLEKNYD